MTIRFIRWCDLTGLSDDPDPIGNRVKFFDSYTDALVWLAHLQKLCDRWNTDPDCPEIRIMKPEIQDITYSSKQELIEKLNKINSIELF